MPTFETPEPISVALDLGAADVLIAATDRRDTVVEVRPGRRADESALKVVEQVRVAYEDGVLRVTGPKARVFAFYRKSRSIEVSVELPVGSTVSGEVQMGDVHGTGRLGACRLKTYDGAIGLERTGPAHLETSDGHVTVDAVDGNAEISVDDGDVHVGRAGGDAQVRASDGNVRIDSVEGDAQVTADDGNVRIGRVGGDATVKNSDGNTTIGTVSGNLRVRADDGDVTVGRVDGALDVRTSDGDVRIDRIGGDAQVAADDGDVRIGHVEGNAQVKSSDGSTTIDTAVGNVRVRADDGGITVRRAGGDVDAKTSDGKIHIGEVVTGWIVLESDDGSLDIGVAESTAAWLEVSTASGRIRNHLETAGAPREDDRTVQVRGRTSSGDITVRRAPGVPSSGPASWPAHDQAEGAER